jgi:thymidylate synthase (FAD)
MLEHGTVYLIIPYEPNTFDRGYKYRDNPYSRVFSVYSQFYITTNYRVILENGWEEDLDYWSESTEFHEKRHTLSLITSIGIGRELCRHRKMSLAQESTRFCKYDKDDMEFIIPYWANLNAGHYEFKGSMGFIGDGFCEEGVWSSKEGKFLWHLSECEDNYKYLINEGLKAQDAREVLPLALKSQLIMTGFESDWKDFLDKRFFEKTGRVHPDMLILAGQIQEQLKLEI